MPRGWTAGLAAARRRGQERGRDQASAALPGEGQPAADRGAAGRRRALLAGVAIAAYLLALVVTLPARLAFDPGPRWAVAGTVWHGQATLAGGWQAEWRFAPLRSLLALAFAADVHVTGPGTELGGTVRAWRGHKAFTDLAGHADGGFVAALVPGLPIACDGALQVALPRLTIAGVESDAAGQVRIAGLACPTGALPPPGAPDLLLRADRVAGEMRFDLAPIGQLRTRLIEGGISGGRLHIAPTPAGLRAMPALAALRIDAAL